jgi:hypothetical protein
MSKAFYCGKISIAYVLHYPIHRASPYNHGTLSVREFSITPPAAHAQTTDGYPPAQESVYGSTPGPCRAIAWYTVKPRQNILYCGAEINRLSFRKV